MTPRQDDAPGRRASRLEVGAPRGAGGVRSRARPTQPPRARRPGVGRRRQFRRIATPSMITLLPLELTLMVRVPVRAAVKLATVMSFLLTVVSE